MEGNCAYPSELRTACLTALAVCRGFSRGVGLALGEDAQLGAPNFCRVSYDLGIGREIRDWDRFTVAIVKTVMEPVEGHFQNISYFCLC